MNEHAHGYNISHSVLIDLFQFFKCLLKKTIFEQGFVYIYNVYIYNVYIECIYTLYTLYTYIQCIYTF